MAFVSGAGAGVPPASNGDASGGGGGNAPSSFGGLSLQQFQEALLQQHLSQNAATQLREQQQQQAQLQQAQQQQAQQQQQQRESLIQQLLASSLLSGALQQPPQQQQQQAAAPSASPMQPSSAATAAAVAALLQQQQHQPQQQQPQPATSNPLASLLQQLQSQLLVQQLLQGAAAAVSTPAPAPTPTPNPLALLSNPTLLLYQQLQQQQQQQQQQLAAAVAASNPLLQHFASALQQQQHQQQQATSAFTSTAASSSASVAAGNSASDAHALLQQRMLMESLLGGGGASSVAASSLASGAAAGTAPPTASAPPRDPQPSAPVARAAGGLTNGAPLVRANSGLDQARAAQSARMRFEAAAAAARAAANAASANNSVDPESVQDHISRLISENEAIVEPAPMLLKRRNYNHRGSGQQTSIDNESNASGSARTSPGLRSLRAQTTRSQSLFELNLKPLCAGGGSGGGSLTTGQPLSRSGNYDSHMLPSSALSASSTSIPPPACAFCGLQFPNEAGLHAHEPRCSRRLAEESASAPGASGGNIAAAAALQLLQQQIAQQQQQQQPSAVPTGAGLISPRTAAGAGSVGTPSASSTPAPCGGQSQMDTRHPLKRRLLASVAQMEESAAKQAKMDLAPRQADEGIVVLESGRVGGQPDVMAILQQQQQQQPIVAAAEPPGLNRRATIATITLDQPQPAPAAQNRLNPEQLHQLLQRLSAAGLKRDDQLLTVVAAAASAQDPSASHTQQPQHQQPSVAPVLQQQLSSPASATDPSGSSSTSVTTGGAGNHQESLSLTQKLQQLHQPPVQQQVPTTGQAGAFSGTNSAALTSRKTPDLPMREDVSVSFQLRRQLAGLCSRPYYLTYPLTECHRDAANRAGYKELQPVVDEPPVSPPYPHEQRNGGRPVRDSLYTTAICTRTLPGAAVQSPLMESVYQVYKPHQGDEAESRLNMLFMSSVAVKPRVGEKTFYKYSMACKEGWQQRMTHSSFWEMSVKQRLCQRREQAEQEQQQDQQLQETAAKSEAAAEDVKMDVVSTNENLPPLQPVGSKAMKTEERASTSSSSATEEKPLKEHIRAMVDGKRKAIDAKIEPPVNTLEEKKAAAAAARALAEELEKEMAAEMPDEMSKMVKYQNKCEPVIGGFRTDEVYVYVRGRGRGRYVCERCGIRCKKPSMLKKHIKSHTDIRPFQCKECNFSFKTKGNLTKHLASKAHRRKHFPPHRTTRVSGGEEAMEVSDDEEEGRLQIAVDDDAANQGGNSPSAQEQQLNDDMSASDDEDFFPEDGLGRHPYHKFGQENILCERGAHTPPSRWMLVDDEPEGQRWPDVNPHNSIRRCLSAPPAAQLSPASPSPKEYNGFTGASSSTMTSPVIGEGGSNGFVVSGTSIASCRMDSVVTAVSMGYVAIDGGNAFRTSAADLMARSGRGLSPTTMQFGNGSGSGNSTSVSAASAPSPYVMEKEELPCGQCPRVFRKASELALHQHTHNLEQRMGAKHRSTFACPECKLTHKTRMQLIKHMEAAHAGSPSMPAGPILQLANAGGAEALGHILDGVDMSSSAAAHLTGIPPSNNPRSFMCSDCNIGFRKHGILAKHLRSKTHVMKLESQKLLPEDSLTLITKKDNGACLSEVDTTNCETARASILRIVDRIRTETAPLGSVPAATVPLGGGGNGMGPIKTFLDSVATSPVASSSSSIIGIAANNNFLRQQPSATLNMQQPQPSAAADGSERSGSFSMRRPSTSLTTPPFADSLQQQRETMLKQLDALRARTAPLETAAATSAAEPSPAQVVTPPALGIFPSSSNANGMTASATIWMPPKAEEVAATVASTSLAGIFQGTDGIPATLNGMPDLERLLRHLQQQRQQNQSQPHPSLNGSTGNGGHSHFLSATPPQFTASSAAALIGVPIPLTQTRCGICETQFESAIEYQVHMLTEHIVVRDGHHLRCPRPHCDKVYPNCESLRTHVVAHFMRASGATPDCIREDGDSLLANGSGIPGVGGLLVDPRLGAAAKDSPLSEATGSVEGGSSCQSPASTDGLRICDEESPAASAAATPATAESSSSSGFRSRTTSSTAKPVKPLPCSLCSSRFSDAMQLQAHWLSHVSKRPHVCEVCDAGFTSAEMLVAHSASAHGQSSGRSPKGGSSTAPSTTQQSTHSQPTFF